MELDEWIRTTFRAGEDVWRVAQSYYHDEPENSYPEFFKIPFRVTKVKDEYDRHGKYWQITLEDDRAGSLDIYPSDYREYHKILFGTEALVDAYILGENEKWMAAAEEEIAASKKGLREMRKRDKNGPRILSKDVFFGGRY